MSPDSPKPRPGGEAALCLVCAWRGDCKKKYSVAGGPSRCPDFSRDLTIKEEPDQEK